MMQESLTFYYCISCGIMRMRNFRDEHCVVCGVVGKVNFVEVSNIGGGGLEVIEGSAPHQ